MSDQEAAPPSQKPPRPEGRDTLEAGIEEGKAAYHPSGFHAVYIGDISNDRYQVLNKIDYGTYSTVWLVEDLNHKDGFLVPTLTVMDGRDTFEREILTHLRDCTPEENTHGQICHMTETFEHQGPNGTHVCLVLELMGENLHSCSPDIKPDNIFVKVRDWSLTESGYLKEVDIPKQDRDEEQYNPIPSCPLRHYYFNEERGKRVDKLDFALGDSGVSSWKDRHLAENITPIALRSPEVLIGAAWDEKTDWWTLGAVVIEVFRAVRMFDGRVPPDGHYEVRQHLAEIVDLFGPFPKTLLERGNKKTVEDVVGEDGQVKGVTLNRPPLVDEIWLGGLTEEARVEFASFLQLMMKIAPAERPSTVDLLRHP